MIIWLHPLNCMLGQVANPHSLSTWIPNCIRKSQLCYILLLVLHTNLLIWVVNILGGRGGISKSSLACIKILRSCKCSSAFSEKWTLMLISTYLVNAPQLRVHISLKYSGNNYHHPANVMQSFFSACVIYYYVLAVSLLTVLCPGKSRVPTVFPRTVKFKVQLANTALW